VHVVLERHGSDDVHAEDTHAQLEHDPVVGPVALPERQLIVSLQNPQPDRTVQSLHVAEDAHGSLTVPHCEAVQSQSLQVPEDGPVPLPVWHVLVLVQKPQDERAVQSLHVVELLHTSVLSQARLNQSQSEQLPVDGPKNVPDRHVSSASQKPQPLVPRHVEHVVSDAQGSAMVVQTPDMHASPEQQSALVVHVCDPVRH
jgi:hypothetical protein